MKLYIEKNYDALSLRAAEIVAERVRHKPKIVLGLPTGSTSLGMYQLLVQAHKKQDLDFSRVRTFNLDEYVGLFSEEPQSYHFFMKQNFFARTNIKPENTFFPEPTIRGCREYEAKIKKAGGIDLQILGIGRNGHIGFNEPGSAFNSRTRIVKLDSKTIKDNARFFEKISDVPKKAVTMGLATIMEAREIVLLASGENKKDAVSKALYGPITTKVPASILQKHKKLIVVLDKTSSTTFISGR